VYECQAVVALVGKRVATALESVVISEAVRTEQLLYALMLGRGLRCFLLFRTFVFF